MIRSKIVFRFGEHLDGVASWAFSDSGDYFMTLYLLSWTVFYGYEGGNGEEIDLASPYGTSSGG